MLSDPVRRRILEIIADEETHAGRIVSIVGKEFGISQPAVSQHLKVLRDHKITVVRSVKTRRIYTINPKSFQEIDHWLLQFRKFWERKLDDLDEEISLNKK